MTKNKAKVRNGTIIEWIVAIVGLFFIISAYVFWAPIGDVLIQVFVENGAPYGQEIFARNMTIYGFVGTGLACIIWAFMSSWRKTVDTGEQVW